ncbi:hypothetical protein [Burkholderia plantarii]|uniref:hypothetical protein n=1 Tax=Burkholderia plantarii TaxID=41899 RepID=UPI001AE03EF1|nr:hypothetical protein [Burkholderia plantarii]
MSSAKVRRYFQIIMRVIIVCGRYAFNGPSFDSPAFSFDPIPGAASIRRSM